MEYTIKEIDNGWLLIGVKDRNFPDAGEATLFLPTISAIADILITWEIEGLVKARGRVKEKEERKHDQS